MSIMLSFLDDVAREAGALLLEYRARGLRTEDKDDVKGGHYATDGDVASQELITRRISQKSDYPIIGEEEEYPETILNECWVIDPVDGTTNYFNGLPEFGVTICRIEDGRPTAGVLYYPVPDEIILVERGQGCTINGRRVDLTTVGRPVDKAVICTDIGSWTPLDVVDGLRNEFAVRSMWSSIWSIRAVLHGQLMSYINMGSTKIWDFAAGALAIEEAGGVAYSPWGEEMKWNRTQLDGVVAINDGWAQRVLAYTKQWPGRG